MKFLSSDWFSLKDVCGYIRFRILELNAMPGWYKHWWIFAGFLGFGAALVIVPILSIALPPVVAIAVLVIIEIPNVVYLVRSNSMKPISKQFNQCYSV